MSNWTAPITDKATIETALKSYDDFWSTVANGKRYDNEVNEDTRLASTDRYIAMKRDFLEKNLADIINSDGFVMKYAPYMFGGELLRLDQNNKLPEFRRYEFRAMRALAATKGLNLSIEVTPWQEPNWVMKLGDEMIPVTGALIMFTVSKLDNVSGFSNTNT